MTQPVRIEYTYIPGVGPAEPDRWEGSHNVPFGASNWHTINTIMVTGELQLNTAGVLPSQLEAWEVTRREIIARVTDYADLPSHRPQSVIEHITKRYGAPPFGAQEVYRYQCELRDAAERVEVGSAGVRV